MISFRLLVAAMVAVSQVALAQDGPWKLVSKHGDLSVYRDGSHALPVYKVEGIVTANLFELLAVTADIPGRTQWVESLKEARILEGDVEQSVVIYEQYALPWPCQNRDSVVESVIHQDLKKLEVSVEYAQVRLAEAPPRPGIVRMPVVRGSMLFRYLDASRSFVQVMIAIDFGGDLPKWVVDMFTRAVPVRTVEGLVGQVRRTREKYADFVRTHEALAREQAEVPFELHELAPDGGAP